MCKCFTFARNELKTAPDPRAFAIRTPFRVRLELGRGGAVCEAPPPRPGPVALHFIANGAGCSDMAIHPRRAANASALVGYESGIEATANTSARSAELPNRRDG